MLTKHPMYILATEGLGKKALRKFDIFIQSMEELEIFNPSDCLVIRMLIDAIAGYEQAREQITKDGFSQESANEKYATVKQNPALQAMLKYSNTIAKLSAELGLTTMARKKLSVLNKKKVETIADILNAPEEA